LLSTFPVTGHIGSFVYTVETAAAPAPAQAPTTDNMQQETKQASAPTSGVVNPLAPPPPIQSAVRL
jgi:hypothetical protein